MKHYSSRGFKPSRNIGFLIRRCATQLSLLSEAAYPSQPLAPARFMALLSLREKSPLSPSELSTRTGYDMGGLTRAVDGLEHAGLVKRERRRADRRAVQIAITARGTRQVERSVAVTVRSLNALLEPFSRREFETLLALLQRLMLRLQGFVETPAPSQPRPAAPKRPRAAKRGTRKKKS